MKTFETEKNNIPEGATHKFDSEGGSGFYRLNGDKWYFWSFGRECWKCVVDNSPLYKSVAIDKPEAVEWNGEGLPPVGVECEWIGGGLNHGDWGLVIVHAYHNDFAWIEKLRDNSMHTVGNPAGFRKPESPEDKEAPDAIHQLDWGQILRSSIKFAKHERAMGEGDVRVGDSDLTSEEFLLMCHNIAEVTEKPETPEAKDKREAVQNAMDFLTEDDHGGEAYHYKGWFEALYDEGMLTNYRKGE